MTSPFMTRVESECLQVRFPNNQQGIISISSHILDNKKIKRVVADEGIGRPEGFEISSTNTLGLRLITDIFQRQLNGSIEHSNLNGTRFSIKFSLHSNYKQ